MLYVWIFRIIILTGGFWLHWGVGAFLLVTLFMHMNRKARMLDHRFNLGLGKAPWYLF